MNTNNNTQNFNTQNKQNPMFSMEPIMVNIQEQKQKLMNGIELLLSFYNTQDLTEERSTGDDNNDEDGWDANDNITSFSLSYELDNNKQATFRLSYTDNDKDESIDLKITTNKRNKIISSYLSGIKPANDNYDEDGWE